MPVWRAEARDEKLYITDGDSLILVGRRSSKYIEKLAQREAERRNKDRTVNDFIFEDKDTFRIIRKGIHRLNELAFKSETRLSYYDNYDIASMTAVLCFKGFKPNKDTSFMTYYYKAIFNGYIDRLRRNGKLKYEYLPITDEIILDGCANYQNKSYMRPIIKNYHTECLKARHRRIVNLYYTGGYTLADIGRKYQITRERVRQLLRKALQHMRIESLILDPTKQKRSGKKNQCARLLNSCIIRRTCLDMLQEKTIEQRELVRALQERLKISKRLTMSRLAYLLRHSLVSKRSEFIKLPDGRRRKLRWLSIITSAYLADSQNNDQT